MDKQEASCPSFRNRERNTTYVITNNIKKESDDEESKMIDDFYEDILKKANCADTQASVLKFLSIFTSIFITLSGSVIGLLNILPFNNLSNSTSTYTGVNVTTIILGFSVTVIKTLLSLFLIEKKSYLLKESALKLKKYAREIKMLKTQNLPMNQVVIKLEEISIKIDELDIYMFSNGNTNSIADNKTDVKVNI